MNWNNGKWPGEKGMGARIREVKLIDHENSPPLFIATWFTIAKI